MAYINKEDTEIKRAKIKALMPSKEGWKLSITNEDYTCLKVSILQAPFEIRVNPDNERENITYHNLEERKNGVEILKKMMEIIDEGNFDKNDIMTDYFHVGFYTRVSIGEWDKPFKIK